jgi:hypothetical protein
MWKKLLSFYDWLALDALKPSPRSTPRFISHFISRLKSHSISRFI